MKKWDIDSVPVIQQDLSHEETLLQIAFALGSLETVATNVFRQVHSHIDKGTTRLSKLQKRCQVVDAKVKKITGINKSIKVISTNKYPVRDDDIFTYQHQPAVVYKRNDDVITRPLSPDKMNMREKLKFFHVKDSLDDNARDYERYPEDGLGEIPHNVKSFCNLFLFNTSINLYKKYKITDPLAQSSKKANVLEEVYKDKLVEPAPTSLDSHFDWTNYRFDQDYFYSPVQNDVPDIDAPVDLPHLSGIAGDLQYTADKKETPKLVETDDKVDSEVKNDDKLGESSSISLATSVESKYTYESTESSEVSLKDEKIEESASKVEMTVQPIPPPPPAPPIPPPLVDLPAPSTSSTNPPQTDLRAHLMDAIRKAGGVSTLKKVEKKNKEVNPIKKSTGNSMMDELHNKLLYRRKGISGKFDSDATLMDKLVSMIPPPPSKPPDPDSDKEWDD